MTKNKLKGMPEGQFVCCSCQGRYKWFVSDGHTKSYISKKNRSYAEKLAYKRYLELYLEELIAEYKASKKYIKGCSKINSASELLINNSEIRELISSQFVPVSEELFKWTMKSYATNPYYTENLVHKSSSGNLLRSKSEVIIDMSLYNAKIPYRYECQLALGKNILYPDFTMRHPVNGRVIYWEHFGKMDDVEYANKACEKIKLYSSHGIIPSVNLILTYETKDNPLTVVKVQRIIDEYFK